jgi:molybdenum cofactor cytidylyltransferase
MNLIKALRLSSAPKVVLVGSGGKTTALFRIAHQLPKPVVVTATTHLAKEQSGYADQHHIVQSIDDLKILDRDLQEIVILLTGPLAGESRLSGLNPEIMKSLVRLAHRRKLGLLVEADGSQTRPLKAPGIHEPAIFPEIWMKECHDQTQTKLANNRNRCLLDAVVVVAGLAGLGNPLTDKWVHRIQEFSKLSGINQGEPIHIQGLKKVLTHPQGGIKNIPSGVRRIALLNQVDTLADISQAQKLAAELIPPFDSVVIGSLGEAIKEQANLGECKNIYDREITAVYEPVAGVVLAAGGSERMGRPKQLLNWQGQTLIRHVVTNALTADLSPLIVVLGAHANEIIKEIADLPVVVVNNEEWQKGQSTSLRAGLDVLPNQVGAAMFLLADQPMISPSLLKSLIEVHTKTLAPIIAPNIQGKRGNPVLFDRDTFTDLKNIHGDTGGRVLFDRYPVMYLAVDDEPILHDIDTLDDYQQLLSTPK